MKIEAKALLIEHVDEALAVEHVVTSKPAPSPQSWPHAAIVRRSIDGDDADITRHAPSMAGFLAAMAASFDWGVPVRSSSDPSRYGGGGIGSSGFGKPPTSLQAREEYALAIRAIERIAAELPAKAVHGGHVFDGAAQVALWSQCHGAGFLEERIIKGGPARRVKGMGLVPATAIVTVPERRKRDASAVSGDLAVVGIVATPHEVGLVCREVSRRVEAAFVSAGWVRPRRKPMVVEVVEEGASMADPDLVEGWKSIVEIVGRSENTCRKLASRERSPLPVSDYLGKPRASRRALELWVSKQTLPWSEAG